MAKPKTLPVIAAAAFSFANVSACGSGIATQSRPIEIQSDAAETPAVSLIAADAAVMSDAELNGLLAAKPTLPDKVRIALLHLRHSGVDDDSPWCGRGCAPLTDDLTATSPEFLRTLRAARLQLELQ